MRDNVLAMMLKREKGVSAATYTDVRSKVHKEDLEKYNAQYPDSPLNIKNIYHLQINNVFDFMNS